MAMVCVNGVRECSGCMGCYSDEDEREPVEIDAIEVYKLWRDAQE